MKIYNCVRSQPLAKRSVLPSSGPPLIKDRHYEGKNAEQCNLAPSNIGASSHGTSTELSHSTVYSVHTDNCRCGRISICRRLASSLCAYGIRYIRLSPLTPISFFASTSLWIENLSRSRAETTVHWEDNKSVLI